MNVVCDQCSATLTLKDRQYPAGTRVQCPKCRHTILLPSEATQAEIVFAEAPPATLPPVPGPPATTAKSQKMRVPPLPEWPADGQVAGQTMAGPSSPPNVAPPSVPVPVLSAAGSAAMGQVPVVPSPGAVGFNLSQPMLLAVVGGVGLFGFAIVGILLLLVFRDGGSRPSREPEEKVAVAAKEDRGNGKSKAEEDEGPVDPAAELKAEKSALLEEQREAERALEQARLELQPVVQQGKQAENAYREVVGTPFRDGTDLDDVLSR